MCNGNCLIFGATNLTKEQVVGKRIIEVGAYNVNGSLRVFYEQFDPAEYVGIDIEEGPGVDIRCSAEDMIEKLGSVSFDILISTELLEHVRNWRKVISNMKNILRPNGLILLTTRSKGAPYHGYPFDFWRYESEDMKHIFADFVIERIESDRESPGVFMKARKPDVFTERDLSDYELFSIVLNQRTTDLDEACHQRFLRYYRKRELFETKMRKISNRSKAILLKLHQIYFLNIKLARNKFTT